MAILARQLLKWHHPMGVAEYMHCKAIIWGSGGCMQTHQR